MSNKTNLRIHPAIGMARVGNSKEYYLGPETMAAAPAKDGGVITGGLPIKPGTENTPIDSNDVRDSENKLKRQAARFKIYQYGTEDTYSYPASAGEEVLIGSTVDGQVVTDIIWTVHLANKKANCWEIDEDANQGIALYENGLTPPLRNPNFADSPTPNPGHVERLKKLVIDAGPRAIQATVNGTAGIEFSKGVAASSYNASTGKIEEIANYPQQFPASDGSSDKYNASSVPITSLGEMYTEANGRLLVVGAYGKACGFDKDGNPDPKAALDKDVDNDNWLDDTGDGPVTAVLVFKDGSHRALEGSAWVVSTDPSYAPQTLNIVSLWDEALNTWVENFDLNPALFSNGKYNPAYKPDFHTDVFPIFNAAHMQRWNTNLNSKAIQAHQNLIQMTDEPFRVGGEKYDILSFIRNPFKDDEIQRGAPLMPLSLGDSAKSFLTVTKTQYTFLEQWYNDQAKGVKHPPLSAGEQLDKSILVNCLGGRFSPGIDLTFIIRDLNFYNKDWKNPAIGTFRVNAEKLDYSKASADQPFLGVGYVPLRPDPIQPGDLCKFMAIPWHTDYNSCATHTPAPNPGGELTATNLNSGVNTTLFWSWPAQRPVAVYTYKDLVREGSLENTRQRYSLRGEGTAVDTNEVTAAADVGRFQDRVNILTNWNRIGVIMQGPAIVGYDNEKFGDDLYLEVESLFETDESNLVRPWANTVTDKVEPPINPTPSGGCPHNPNNQA